MLESGGIKGQEMSGVAGATTHGVDQAQPWNGEHTRTHDVMSGWATSK